MATTLSPNIDENNQQILSDIQSLQSIEQSLFVSLEENPNLSVEEQQQLISKISDITNMRMNLYHTLNDVNGFFNSALTTSEGTLQEQSAAISIVEQELNNSKKQLNLLQEQKNSKIRLIEINNFYGDKYVEHSNLMILFLKLFGFILILFLLFHNNLLPQYIFIPLVLLASFYYGYYIVLKSISIWYRDNMNFQEYSWYFDAASAPAAPTTKAKDPWAKATSSVVTVCPSSSSSNTEEGFHMPGNYFKY